MKKSLLLITSALLFSLLGWYSEPTIAWAQGQADQIQLTALPPRLGEDFTLRADPGELIQTSVRLRNNSSTPVTIQTTVEDFILGEDGSTPIPVREDVSTRWSLADWSQVVPTGQVIEAGETANITLLVQVPEDALPGGHYGMIVNQPVPAGAGEGAAAVIGQRVGTLVYLIVNGPINEEAFIRNVQFPRITEYGPVPFSFEIDNVSDIHIRPQTTVEIFNMFGDRVDSIEIQTKNVFPFIARSFEGSWDRTWGTGRYTARITMSYGTEGQIAIAETTFWLLPYTIIIVSVVALLAIIVMIIAAMRHRKHSREYNQKKVDALQKRINELENN